eukprot:4871974-Alexandrium_andersonii.AAC.1
MCATPPNSPEPPECRKRLRRRARRAYLAGRPLAGGQQRRRPRSTCASGLCARLSGEPRGPLGGARARGPAGG